MKSLNRIGKEFNDHSGARPAFLDGLKRAEEELNEAILAYYQADGSDNQDLIDAVLEEMADVVLTLASVAEMHGLDLDLMVQLKHAKNLARKWGPHPTLSGAVKHIKGT